MPLHDWTDDARWDGFHLLWIAHLFHSIKPQLPDGFRIYVGSGPPFPVAGLHLPDLAMLQWLEEREPSVAGGSAHGNGAAAYRDEPAAPIAHDPQPALFVMLRERLIAVMELVSKRSKERANIGVYYCGRYLACLKAGAHLLLVDVHRQPQNVSFADGLLAHMQIDAPLTPPPLAICYRMDAATATGITVGLCPRMLTVREPLPTMPLPLIFPAVIDVDLETTYMQAAADAYLA